jgi:hypothetical protein
MIIRIPNDVKIHELRDSIVWFDKDGVLYSVPKDQAAEVLSMEEIESEMKNFREITGGKKVCMIAESNNRAASPPKDQRDFIADQINSVTKAMAIISSSPLSRMAANLFFSFKPPTYPFKMFSNEKDAKEWIKQYI